MKNLLLTTFLLAFTIISKAQTVKVDTVITETWSGTAWEKYSKLTNSYDANCLLSTLLLQTWNATSSTWENSVLTKNTYGSNNQISTQLLQSWDVVTSSWVDNLRSNYFYDVSDRIDYYTTESNILGTWAIYSQSNYSYNSSGQNDSILTQIAAFGPLQNSALTIFYYNSDGTQHQILQQGWDFITSTWNNLSRLTYTYNTSGKPLTQLVEIWQTGVWVNSRYSTFTYDGSGNLTNSLDQEWSGTTWVDASRSTYSYTSSCTLPLKLLSFTATKEKTAVQLNWQTAEEVNTAHFNIQRSTDGINFSNLGKVNAKGSGNASYTYADNIANIAGGKAYYRLQMMDKDGKYTFSKIIPLALELFAGTIRTYPNPVKNQLYVLYNAQSATKATLRITDVSGKIVHSQIVGLSSNAVSVNVSGLGKGVYYVQLITDKSTQRTSFVKE